MYFPVDLNSLKVQDYFRFYGSSYLHHCIIKDPILDTVICSVSHFHVEKWC